MLVILGLVGGSTLVVQLPLSSYTADAINRVPTFYNPNASPGDKASLPPCGREGIETRSASFAEGPYGSSVQAIVQVNHILNVNKIFPGQKVCIPVSNMSRRTERTNTNQSAVAAMIDRVFGPYSPGALHVAMCESGLNPNAYNDAMTFDGNYTVGVFQILYPSTWMRTPEAASSPYDAMANVLAAYSIFARDGYSWREWTCRP